MIDYHRFIDSNNKVPSYGKCNMLPKNVQDFSFTEQLLEQDVRRNAWIMKALNAGLGIFFL